MRLDEYLAYHRESARAGDIDPSYAMLRYVCDRFELNIEQRYWLAFLYALTYCGASTFYLYNEWPDMEGVDSGRLQRWWESRGRTEIMCQTDRRWIRSSNMFVPAVEAYRAWVGDRLQEEHFATLASGETPEARHDAVYASAKKNLYGFGQFSLFLYLEALHTITPLDLEPTDLDLDVAHSCRNGLCYAYGYDQWLTKAEARTPSGSHDAIRRAWDDLCARLRREVTPRPTIWNTETVLCAYKKYKRGKRYLGYYVDRQAVETAKMATRVSDGVAWWVLWQFREETYAAGYRVEATEPIERLAVRGVGSAWKAKRLAETARVVQSVEPEWTLT